MYSTQPAQLATQRGVRGLPMVLAAIAVLVTAALAVAIAMAVASAAKAPVGDHSRDVSESIRGAAFLAADHSLDQIETQRQVAFSKAHRPGAAVTIPTSPVVTADDSTEALRREHRPIVAAPKLAPAATSFGDLGIAPRTTQAAPAVSWTETTDSLRKEHLGIAPATTSDSIYKGHLRRVPLTKPAAPAVTYDTWGGGR